MMTNKIILSLLLFAFLLVLQIINSEKKKRKVVHKRKVNEFIDQKLQE